MRRARRNGHGGMEFGGSGEDSFVAVVVTKLTGALLFILLLTMVIMALLPKAVDMGTSHADRSQEPAPDLKITTPERLPEAIAGRPYVLALAATGGRGPLHWSIDGKLPDGLTFDPENARLEGTPRKGTAEPASLILRVNDGAAHAAQDTRLVVYESDHPLSTPTRWRPALPPIAWSAWLEQGVGFLLLWLVHLVGMNAINGLERQRLLAHEAVVELNGGRPAGANRFALYRLTVRIATVTATAALVVWLWLHRV